MQYQGVETVIGSGHNLEPRVIDGFGEEWSRFDQSALSEVEQQNMFDSYFANFPWELLPANPVGFDLGCGSGRWAKRVAPLVGELHCIDASAAALDVAKRNLRRQPNCQFHHASVDSIPLQDCSADFGFSLGVLHHIPDTQAGLTACVRELKTGGPFLVYLYYAFDNRPFGSACCGNAVSLADFSFPGHALCSLRNMRNNRGNSLLAPGTPRSYP